MSDTLSDTFCDDDFAECSYSGLSGSDVMSDYKAEFPMDDLLPEFLTQIPEIKGVDVDSEQANELGKARRYQPYQSRRSRDHIENQPLPKYYPETRRPNKTHPLSKNAILARENREKKKQYIDGLERQVCDLTAKNQKIERCCLTLQKTVTSLHSEVQYLRNVIRNQSTLSHLLQNIPNILATDCATVGKFDDLVREEAYGKYDLQPSDTEFLPNIDEDLAIDEVSPSASGVQVYDDSDLQSDFNVSEHDYARSQRFMRSSAKPARSSAGAGVCLHVANNRVMLEMCASCNNNAQRQQITTK